ncbi:hypothetical protein H1C71_042695 [Ictidomys tridecemlineatus]|nr:hypothetical protein H1C71_042695 [Ictidomys tridecemlineatus]
MAHVSLSPLPVAAEAICGLWAAGQRGQLCLGHSGNPAHLFQAQEAPGAPLAEGASPPPAIWHRQVTGLEDDASSPRDTASPQLGTPLATGPVDRGPGQGRRCCPALGSAPR